MNHIGHGTDFADGIERNQCLRRIGHADADGLALLHTEMKKCLGRFINLIQKGFIGHTVSEVIVADPLRVLTRRFLKQGINGKRGVGKVLFHPVIRGIPRGFDFTFACGLHF